MALEADLHRLHQWGPLPSYFGKDSASGVLAGYLRAEREVQVFIPPGPTLLGYWLAVVCEGHSPYPSYSYSSLSGFS